MTYTVESLVYLVGSFMSGYLMVRSFLVWRERGRR